MNDKKIDIVRAWKDAEYRASLSQEELDQLPPNPVGEAEQLDVEQLDEVNGGGTLTIIPVLSLSNMCPSIDTTCPSGVTACYSARLTWCSTAYIIC